MSGEERIKNKIESNNKKYIYIYRKKTRNTGGKGLTLVGGLTPGKARPHTRERTVTSIRVVMDTHTPPRHYSLLHKQTLTESGSRLKACGGGGLFKAKSVPAGGRQCAPAPAHMGLPWPPRAGSEAGVCRLPMGGMSRSQGQKTSHGGGSNNVLCILCRLLAEKRAPPHTRGRRPWVQPALAGVKALAEPTSCVGAVGRPSSWL